MNDTPVEGMTDDMWTKLQSPAEPEVEEVGELELTEEEINAPGVVEALVAEIQERAANSVQYIEERDGAKTEVKRKHFHNKLVKNNEIASTLIVALERVMNKRKEREAAIQAEGHVSEEGSREEPSN